MTDSENNQNIISAFLNHQTICQGYAYATQYLLDRLDIPCTTVTGTAEGEGHAWNLVVMDDAYYYVDTTWGNSQYAYREDDSVEGLNKYINYSFMGVDSASLFMTHTADPDIPLPDCTATRNNYYIHEGRYVYEWNPDMIGRILIDGREGGEELIQIKFADKELFEQALVYFVEDFHVRDYCPDLNSINYMENDKNNVLFFKI